MVIFCIQHIYLPKIILKIHGDKKILFQSFLREKNQEGTEIKQNSSHFYESCMGGSPGDVSEEPVT